MDQCSAFGHPGGQDGPSPPGSPPPAPSAASSPELPVVSAFQSPSVAQRDPMGAILLRLDQQEDRITQLETDRDHDRNHLAALTDANTQLRTQVDNLSTSHAAQTDLVLSLSSTVDAQKKQIRRSSTDNLALRKHVHELQTRTFPEGCWLSERQAQAEDEQSEEEGGQLPELGWHMVWSKEERRASSPYLLKPLASILSLPPEVMDMIPWCGWWGMPTEMELTEQDRYSVALSCKALFERFYWQTHPRPHHNQTPSSIARFLSSKCSVPNGHLTSVSAHHYQDLDLTFTCIPERQPPSSLIDPHLELLRRDPPPRPYPVRELEITLREHPMLDELARLGPILRLLNPRKVVIEQDISRDTAYIAPGTASSDPRLSFLDAWDRLEAVTTAQLVLLPWEPGSDLPAQSIFEPLLLRSAASSASPMRIETRVQFAARPVPEEPERSDAFESVEDFIEREWRILNKDDLTREYWLYQKLVKL